jgi:hypothetical protein
LLIDLFLPNKCFIFANRKYINQNKEIMCLQKKLHAKSKKAKEDVVCYKVVNQDLSALVFPSFKYKLNEMAQSGLISNDYVVFEGLHSFANKEEAMAFCKCLCKKCV